MLRNTIVNAKGSNETSLNDQKCLSTTFGPGRSAEMKAFHSHSALKFRLQTILPSNDDDDDKATCGFFCPNGNYSKVKQALQSRHGRCGLRIGDERNAIKNSHFAIESVHEVGVKCYLHESMPSSAAAKSGTWFVQIGDNVENGESAARHLIEELVDLLNGSTLIAVKVRAVDIEVVHDTSVYLPGRFELGSKHMHELNQRIVGAMEKDQTVFPAADFVEVPLINSPQLIVATKKTSDKNMKLYVYANGKMTVRRSAVDGSSIKVDDKVQNEFALKILEEFLPHALKKLDALKAPSVIVPKSTTEALCEKITAELVLRLQQKCGIEAAVIETNDGEPPSTRGDDDSSSAASSMAPNYSKSMMTSSSLVAAKPLTRAISPLPDTRNKKTRVHPLPVAYEKTRRPVDQRRPDKRNNLEIIDEFDAAVADADDGPDVVKNKRNRNDNGERSTSVIRVKERLAMGTRAGGVGRDRNHEIQTVGTISTITSSSSSVTSIPVPVCYKNNNNSTGKNTSKKLSSTIMQKARRSASRRPPQRAYIDSSDEEDEKDQKIEQSLLQNSRISSSVSQNSNRSQNNRNASSSFAKSVSSTNSAAATGNMVLVEKILPYPKVLDRNNTKYDFPEINVDENEERISKMYAGVWPVTEERFMLHIKRTIRFLRSRKSRDDNETDSNRNKQKKKKKKDRKNRRKRGQGSDDHDSTTTDGDGSTSTVRESTGPGSSSNSSDSPEAQIEADGEEVGEENGQEELSSTSAVDGTKEIMFELDAAEPV